MRRFFLCLGVGWLVGAFWAEANSIETIFFQFRQPDKRSYRVPALALSQADSRARQEWVRAYEKGTDRPVEFGARLVLQLGAGAVPDRVVDSRRLSVVRAVQPGVWILQAPDAWTAMTEAQRLSRAVGVEACYPVVRRQAALGSLYAAKPNDPYFGAQGYLEYRDATGRLIGADINARGAWPYSRGDRVVVAVADVGVELDHPELLHRIEPGLAHNFFDGSTDAAPAGTSRLWAHGTSVAGLVLAEGNNGLGMSGVAPAARLAAWVIRMPDLMLVDDEALMEMYQHRMETVSVENHSWNITGVGQGGPTLLEQIGISNAVHQGRAGRGVIMVRSAGNDPDRQTSANANDDGYVSDPHVVGVAAVRNDGRAASYSKPGACLLVAAPGGDQGTNLFSLDLVGPKGANVIPFFPPNTNLWDYVFNATSSPGTSFAAPLVTGTIALILAANPALTYRDVQQILIHAARHLDARSYAGLAAPDPDLVTNGAGFEVSHNDGFGVPDAGFAVRLARGWSNRPALVSLTLTATQAMAVPDAGLRLEVSEQINSAPILTITGLPGQGAHPDDPTARLPLVALGMATNTVAVDLHGKGALIERGANTFEEKIERAAAAGAAFVVIYNSLTGTAECPGGDVVCPMSGTAFAPVPAMFIGRSDGELIRGSLENTPGLAARMFLRSAQVDFVVTNTLVCEHVGVRVMADHPARGDLRITLRSPQGTRSVLQTFNADTSPGPDGWVYYSTHHFYESSCGTWTVAVTDESAGFAGTIGQVQLIVTGTTITDSDADGLDDDWERSYLGRLDDGPRDDPDRDGYSNAREQIIGTDPTNPDQMFRLDLSLWNQERVRLNWPAVAERDYEIWTANDPGRWMVYTNVPGRFPEREWFDNRSGHDRRFFKAREADPLP